MIRKFFFFLSEAFIGMRRSGFMIAVSLATVFISMVMFGLFLIGNLNLSELSVFLNSKVEVRVFLKDSLTKKEIFYLKDRLASLKGVKQVKFIEKKRAWHEFKQTYKNLSIGNVVNDNPLPASLSLKLDSNVKAKHIASIASGYKLYVEDVVFGGVIAEKIQTLSRFILVLGWAVVGLLSVVTLLIVINTVRLTIINREEEISIMKLVGATDSFVMGPFLVEGLVLGGGASVIAIVVIHGLMKVVETNFLLAFPFFRYQFTLENQILVYSILFLWGSLLCFMGALFSTRATLKNSL